MWRKIRWAYSFTWQQSILTAITSDNSDKRPPDYVMLDVYTGIQIFFLDEGTLASSWFYSSSTDLPVWAGWSVHSGGSCVMTLTNDDCNARGDKQNTVESRAPRRTRILTILLLAGNQNISAPRGIRRKYFISMGFWVRLSTWEKSLHKKFKELT